MTSLARRTIFVLACTLTVTSVSHAQRANGSISGKLIDQNGAAITQLEATITLKDTATGETKTAVVANSGEYSIAGLKAGLGTIADIAMPLSGIADSRTIARSCIQ